VFFNVKDYGAKGDGVTPDDDAIRQAIEACTSSKANGMYSGGVVYFPPGLYIINNPLVLTAAINVRLAGTERFASTIQAGPKFSKTLGAVATQTFRSVTL
jgi:polygalacturonase